MSFRKQNKKNTELSHQGQHKLEDYFFFPHYLRYYPLYVKDITINHPSVLIFFVLLNDDIETVFFLT